MVRRILFPSSKRVEKRSQQANEQMTSLESDAGDHIAADDRLAAAGRGRLEVAEVGSIERGQGAWRVSDRKA